MYVLTIMMLIKITQVLQLCVVPPTHEAWSRVGTVQRRKSTFGKCKRLLPWQSMSNKQTSENIAIFVNAVSGHSLLWLKLFHCHIIFMNDSFLYYFVIVGDSYLFCYRIFLGNIQSLWDKMKQIILLNERLHLNICVMAL